MRLDEIIVFLEKSWFERTGLVVALVTATGGIGAILLANFSWIGCAALVIVDVFIIAAWLYSRRPPRTPKNKVGFVVSITYSDDKEGQKLQEDFVEPLRQLIKSGNTGHAFHFMVLPQFHARTIVDVECATAMRLRTAAHFMIYGRVRLRQLAGKDHHVIDLEGIVAHTPLSDAVRKALATEFSELLPRKVHISIENDLLSFQITSEWIDVVARYIIGLAASCSGDLDYAEDLLKQSYERIKGKDRTFPIYQKLSSRIPLRISDLYCTRAKLNMRQWTETRSIDRLVATKSMLESVHQSHQDLEDVLYLKAILTFVQSRDVAGALQILNKVKERGTAVWHLNVAFLYAYKGDMLKATRHYRHAARLEAEADVIQQVESFLVWVLEQDPDRIQLYFCLAFFNWQLKGDEIRAVKDFQQFVENPEAAKRFPKERQLAEEWMNALPQV